MPYPIWGNLKEVVREFQPPFVVIEGSRRRVGLFVASLRPVSPCPDSCDAERSRQSELLRIARNGVQDHMRKAASVEALLLAFALAIAEAEHT
jgi:hypothetical protein